MIPRIKRFKTLDNYRLDVVFDDNEHVVYDVKEDIDTIGAFKSLLTEYGLFSAAELDTSRTVIYWSDAIDLPSDIIYEYGERLA